MPTKPRSPKANASGPRPKPAEPKTGSGTAVRIGPEAKNVVMRHAIILSEQEHRLVSMRDALDDIIIQWSRTNDEGKP